MISPLILKAFCNDMQNKIEAINKNEVVIDDSQLSKFLEALKPNENLFLLGIIPEYVVTGEQDKTKYKNQLMFNILKKTTASNLKHDEFIQILNETVLAAKKFVEILVSEKSGDDGDFCGVANDIIENSIRVYPIWNKAECHGWAIDVDLLSNL